MLGLGVSAAADEQLMMLPPSACSTMTRPAAWHPKNTPFRLTAMIRSRSSSDSSRNGPPNMIPAMLHQTWMPPRSAATRWARASTSVRRETSRAAPSADPPEAMISSAVVRAVSSWMSAHTTVAPAPARARALAFPIPLPAPVTTATFPSTRNDSMSVVASMVREDLSEWADGFRPGGRGARRRVPYGLGRARNSRVPVTGETGSAESPSQGGPDRREAGSVGRQGGDDPGQLVFLVIGSRIIDSRIIDSEVIGRVIGSGPAPEGPSGLLEGFDARQLRGAAHGRGEGLGHGGGDPLVPLVVGVDPVPEMAGVDDGLPGHEGQGVVPRDDTVAGGRLDGMADLGQGGAELVGLVLGIGSEDRADHHDRHERVTAPEHVEEAGEPLGHHPDAVGDAGPATRPVGHGDDVGREGGDVLGRDDLASPGGGIAQVGQVEPGLAGGDGRPSLGRARCDPPLGDGVAVGDPAGEGRGRPDLTDR